MSQTLRIKHDTWEVVTSSWTVAAKLGKTVVLCYSWSSMDGMGFLDQSTGVAQTELNLTMPQFLKILNQWGHDAAPIDLRAWTK
jgi:hypothetical protein